MSNKVEIGTISVKGNCEVEWTIQDFFSYTTVDKFYCSPSFDVSGSKWFLRVYPNGQTRDNFVGWTGLYLNRENVSAPPQGTCYTFGLKKADGTVERMKGHRSTWVFDERGKGLGWSKFVERSELQRRKAELAPSDAITVACNLKVYKADEFSASLDTLSHNLNELFISQKGCDVTLKVKQQEFPVHKCILSVRSTVFAAMFEADMKEKRTGVVDIEDCDPKAFREFLLYIYTGKTENLSSNALELYRISDKYDVEDLMSDCLISMVLHLSVENVLDVALLGHQFSIHEIKAKASRFFYDNFGEIVSSAPWKPFLKSNCGVANELLTDMASQMKSKK